MLQAIILILIAMAAAFWWFRFKREKPAAVRAARQANPDPYHCVEVCSGSGACAAVASLSGKRYLSAEAPALPVPGCSAQACTCRYVHHDDRRHEFRRNPYGQWAAVPPAIAGERRSRNDRRKSGGNEFRPSIAR